MTSELNKKNYKEKRTKSVPLKLTRFNEKKSDTTNILNEVKHKSLNPPNNNFFI